MMTHPWANQLSTNPQTETSFSRKQKCDSDKTALTGDNENRKHNQFHSCKWYGNLHLKTNFFAARKSTATAAASLSNNQFSKLMTTKEQQFYLKETYLKAVLTVQGTLSEVSTSSTADWPVLPNSSLVIMKEGMPNGIIPARPSLPRSFLKMRRNQRQVAEKYMQDDQRFIIIHSFLFIRTCFFFLRLSVLIFCQFEA